MSVPEISDEQLAVIRKKIKEREHRLSGQSVPQEETIVCDRPCLLTRSGLSGSCVLPFFFIYRSDWFKKKGFSWSKPIDRVLIALSAASVLYFGSMSAHYLQRAALNLPLREPSSMIIMKAGTSKQTAEIDKDLLPFISAEEQLKSQMQDRLKGKTTKNTDSVVDQVERLRNRTMAYHGGMALMGMMGIEIVNRVFRAMYRPDPRSTLTTGLAKGTIPLRSTISYSIVSCVFFAGATFSGYHMYKLVKATSIGTKDEHYDTQ